MSNRFKEIRDWATTILVALVISMVFHTYVAEARLIPSGSMLPTLRVGDRVIVDKISYHFKGIREGDIIIFQAPPSSHLNEVLIKRAIGLPGDTIAIRKGFVYRNATPLKEPYELEKPVQDFGPVEVPADAVFVMGDNRNDSYDSRFWGFVPEKSIIGRAFARYYPLPTATIF